MKRNVLFGVGAAILLILGVWVWQSVHTPEPRTEETQTRPANKPELSVETLPPSPPPPPTPPMPEPTPEADGESCSISGTVRLKATGAPVVGASVQAWNHSHGFRSAVVSTDENGIYTLTGLPIDRKFLMRAWGPSEEYYIANGDEVVVDTLKQNEKKTGVDIKLSKGASKTIAGIVVGRRVLYQVPDNPTSATWFKNYERNEDAPLSGIRVVLDPEKNVSQEVLTDTAGRFRFEKVRPMMHIVRPDLPEKAAFITEEERTQRVFLADAPALESRYPSPGIGGGYPTPPEEGGYSSPGGNNGRIQTSYPNYEKPDPENVLFIFRLDGVSVEGLVSNNQGKPISGAEIQISQSLPSKYPVKITSVLSNSQGQYRIDNLPVSDLGEGIYYLRPDPNNNRGLFLETRNMEFFLECQVQGYCQAETRIPPYPERLLKVALMFEENFLKHLPPERVRNFPPIYPEVKLPAGQGDVITGVDFILPPSGTITGRVVDRQGNPLRSVEKKKSGASVLLHRVNNQSEKHIQTRETMKIKDLISGIVDDNSCFRLENIPPGRYEFRLGRVWGREQPWVVKSLNEPITLHEGETLENVDVVVSSETEQGTLIGHVVDAMSGKPVLSLSVGIVKEDGSIETWPQNSFIKTRQSSGFPNDPNNPVAEGDFTIEFLPIGKTTLKLSAPGYAPVQVEVEVPEGDIVEQTFQMGGVGGLVGRVLDAETKEPIERFEVKVTHADGEKKGQPVEGQVQMDKNEKGTFRLSGLSAGRVTVTISEVAERGMDGSGMGGGGSGTPAPEKPTHSDAVEEVDITVGKTTEQTFLLGGKGFLTGRVTVEGDPGRRRFYLRKTGEDRWKSFNVRMEADGRYKSEALNTGDYTVRLVLRQDCGFQKNTRVYREEMAEVAIQPGEETEQDFEFKGGASILGTFKASDRNLFWRVVVVKGTHSTFDFNDPAARENIQATVERLEQGDRYEIHYLSPGTYTLFATQRKESTGAAAPVAEKSQTVTLTEGQAATVDFELP